jgi:excisionase family DNA binding protein
MENIITCPVTDAIAPASIIEPDQTNASAAPEFMKPAEVATRLNISRAALYELIARHDLAAYRIGRAVRITPGDLDVFLASRRFERQPRQLRYGRYPQS